MSNNQFAQLYAPYAVAQLEAAAKRENAFGLAYALTSADFLGATRWVGLNLFAPQVTESGDIQVKLSMSYIPGARTNNKKVPAAVILGSGSTESNWKNLNSGYVLLEDLFACGCLAESSFRRVADWAKANATSVGELNGSKLQILPGAGGVFAFNLRIALNPTTGALAKNPIGIGEFGMSGFDVNTSSPIRSLNGRTSDSRFAVRVSADRIPVGMPQPVAHIPNPIDDGMEDAVYVPSVIPNVPQAADVSGLVPMPAAVGLAPLGDDDLPF